MKINANLVRAHFKRQCDIFNKFVTGRTIVDLLKRYDLDRSRHKTNEYIELDQSLRATLEETEDIKDAYQWFISNGECFFEISGLDKVLSELPFTFIDDVGDLILHEPNKNWVDIYKNAYGLTYSWLREQGMKSCDIDNNRRITEAGTLVRKYHYHRKLTELI